MVLTYNGFLSVLSPPCCVAERLSSVFYRKVVLRAYLDVDETLLKTFAVHKLAKPDLVHDGDLGQFYPLILAVSQWQTDFLQYQRGICEGTTTKPTSPTYCPSANVNGM